MLKNNWIPTDKLTSRDLNDIADNVNNNTEHRETKINENDYTHGLKYNKEQNSLIIKTDTGDVSIGGSNDASDIQFTPDDSGLTSNNVEDSIKEINTNIKEHKELNITNTNGIHGFKYNKDDNKQYYYDSGSWHPIESNVDLSLIFNLFKESIDENVHSIQYDDLIIDGGCYNSLEKKYYINKIESMSINSKVDNESEGIRSVLLWY